MNRKEFDRISDMIFAEIQRAVKKHPEFPSDPGGIMLIIAEEVGEAVRASNLLTYDRCGTKEELVTEIIQSAGTCYRGLLELCNPGQREKKESDMKTTTETFKENSRTREVLDDEYFVAQTTDTFSGRPEYVYWVDVGCYQLTDIGSATALEDTEIDQVKRTGKLGDIPGLKLVRVKKVFILEEDCNENNLRVQGK